MAQSKKKKLDHMFNKLANLEPASSVLVARVAVKHKKSSQPERVPIRAGYCSGCNMRVPSRLLQRALAGTTIQCEQCSRRLYVEAD